jgi:hypothetical protein
MRLLAAAVSLVLLASSAWAVHEGEYDVEGTNPGSGSGYSGTVRVSRTGETYNVVWTVGGTRYVGTGIGNKDFLAVSYRSGNSTGLALYGQADGSWQGIWTYAGSREVGTERWTPR